MLWVICSNLEVYPILRMFKMGLSEIFFPWAVGAVEYVEWIDSWGVGRNTPCARNERLDAEVSEALEKTMSDTISKKHQKLMLVFNGWLEKWKHWWLLMENPLNWLSTPPSISGCEFPTQTSGWTPTQPECIRVLCANHHCNWWDHSTVGYSGSWSRTISGEHCHPPRFRDLDG